MIITSYCDYDHSSNLAGAAHCPPTARPPWVEVSQQSCHSWGSCWETGQWTTRPAPVPSLRSILEPVIRGCAVLHRSRHSCCLETSRWKSWRIVNANSNLAVYFRPSGFIPSFYVAALTLNRSQIVIIYIRSIAHGILQLFGGSTMLQHRVGGIKFKYFAYLCGSYQK